MLHTIFFLDDSKDPVRDRLDFAGSRHFLVVMRIVLFCVACRYLEYAEEFKSQQLSGDLTEADFKRWDDIRTEGQAYAGETAVDPVKEVRREPAGPDAPDEDVSSEPSEPIASFDSEESVSSSDSDVEMQDSITKKMRVEQSSAAASSDSLEIVYPNGTEAVSFVDHSPDSELVSRNPDWPTVVPASWFVPA